MKYRIDTIRPLAVLLLLLVLYCCTPVPAATDAPPVAATPAHGHPAETAIPADWIDNPTGGVVFDPAED